MKHLKTVRELKRLTVEELATLSGISPETISCIERGEPATTEEYRRIAGALGIPLKAFL